MELSGELQERVQESVEKASRLVAGSRYVVAMVGAGMSAESGIPTYRGPGGLWTRIGEPDPRSYQAFVADPKGWWERTLDREQNPEQPERAHMREAMANARPNPGHYALVALERMEILKHIITQNVDNLHREAGSTGLSEIHGNRTLLRCMDCSLRLRREEVQIVEVPPLCPECGGVIKSDGVMFGEPIPQDVLERCFRETELCDCMLVLGTSGTVYPAAGFPLEAQRRGAPIIEINVNRTPLTEITDVSLQGPTGELLPPLVARVRQLVSEAEK